jgi:hypothetical protein
MEDQSEQCSLLRYRVAAYIERFLENRGITLETNYLDRAVKMFYRPEDGGDRSLTIATYWKDGFFVWVVWKGENGERADVYAKIVEEELERKEFPEFDHLLVEL